MTKSAVIKESFQKERVTRGGGGFAVLHFQIRLHKRWGRRLCIAVHPLRPAFGIPRMFAWIVPGGSLGTVLALFLPNFIIGGVMAVTAAPGNNRR